MLVKFFARGTGGGKGPVEYITRQDDPATKQLRQPAPEIVRGNPEITRRLIDALDFKHKYRSGVLSFAPSDNPTDREIESIIDDFEAYAFAGLEPDGYNTLWVKHTHTGHNRVELHFVTPRVELTTGKSLNIAPPGWHSYFKPWQTKWNLEKAWARPDDPQRKREVEPGFISLINQSRKAQGQTTIRDTKLLLTELVKERITAGLINNRTDIIDFFKSELGLEITRAGKDYITVADPETKKRYRLKGKLYEREFRPQRQVRAETNSRERVDSTANRPELLQVRARVAENEQYRASYHQKRYGASKPDRDSVARQILANARTHRPSSLVGYVSRQLGADSLLERSSTGESKNLGFNQSTDRSTVSGIETARENSRVPQGADRRNSHNSERQRDISDSPSQFPANSWLGVSGATLSESGVGEKSEVGSQESGIGSQEFSGEEEVLSHTEIDLLEKSKVKDEKNQLEINPSASCLLPSAFKPSNQNPLAINHERIGKEINREFQLSSQTIQTGHEQLVRQVQQGYESSGAAEQTATDTSTTITSTGSELERTNQQLHQRNQELERHQRQVERNFSGVRGALKRKRERELERFKTEINLVEYALAQGYEYLASESSRNSAVLRESSSGDKIIVATDSDNHGIYFSLRDDGDNGSIIDFIQQRNSWDLGQVRKELRPWLNSQKVQDHPSALLARSLADETLCEAVSFRAAGSLACPLPPAFFCIAKPKVVNKDRLSIIRKYATFSSLPERSYLSEHRGIKLSTSNRDRFVNCIAIDNRNNIIFPHYDRDGLTGYSIKNRDFTGFSSGGTKALWQSNHQPSDDKLVITESAIDALSYSQLFDEPNTRYLATGGSLSQSQRDLIQEVLAQTHNQGLKIVIATDNDEVGEKLKDDLARLTPSNASVYRSSPQNGAKDWNELLLVQQEEEQRQREIQQSKLSQERGGFSL